VSGQFKIKVNLFGAFREFSDTGFLVFSVNGNESAEQVKLLISKRLQAKENSFDVKALVAKSVLATADRILMASDIIGSSDLSILPPVCGG
jgi:hypothetical protein